MSPHDPVLIAFLDAAREALGETAGAAAARVAQSGFHAVTVALAAGAAFVLMRTFRSLGGTPERAGRGDGAGLRIFHALFASCSLLCLVFGEDVFHAHSVALVLLGLLVAVALFLLVVRGGGRVAERLLARGKAWREGAPSPPHPLPLRGEALARRGARALRRALLPPFVTLGVVVAALGAWLIVGNALGRAACREAVPRAGKGDRPRALAEEVRSAPSPTALRLEELSRGLGLDLTPAPRKGPAPDSGRVEEFGKIVQPLRLHLARRSRRPDDEFPRAPEPIRDFLFVHRETLSKVRTLLGGAEELYWECRPGDGFDGPAPAHLALLRLSHVLVADAYEAAADGDVARAASGLSASFALAKALEARPERYSQVFAVLMLNTQMGLLRKLDPAPPGWEARLLGHDFRAALARAADVEAASWARFGLEGCSGLEPRKTAIARFAAAIARPAVRFSVASNATRLSTTVPAATALEFDAFAIRARSRALDPVFPAWDLFGPACPNPSSALRRLARFEIDRDLTLAVLRLKAGAPRPGGALSLPGAEVEGSVPSIASGRSWVYRTRDGHLVDVHLDGAWPSSADEHALALPVSWVGRRSSRRARP